MELVLPHCLLVFEVTLFFCHCLCFHLNVFLYFQYKKLIYLINFEGGVGEEEVNIGSCLSSSAYNLIFFFFKNLFPYFVNSSFNKKILKKEFAQNFYWRFKSLGEKQL